MKAKERHKHKLLEYLGNPENKFCNRASMSRFILGFKEVSYIYKVFTTDELSEIEKEALALRRKKYNPEIAKIDKAMLKEARLGNEKAAKLCYQRFEDWGEKKIIDAGGNMMSLVSAHLTQKKRGKDEDKI